MPTVMTVKTVSVNPVTLETTGRIISDGGSPIIDRGVCWSKTSPIDTANSTCQSSDSTSTEFSVSVTGLTSETTYYIRAYAKNSVGTGFGNQMTFMTTACDTLAQFTATPMYGPAPLTVNFDAKGSIGNLVWDYGDKSAIGTGLTGSHQYNTSGIYTVTLTAADTTTSCKDIAEKIITVGKLSGDGNNDGYVNLYDALLITAYINGAIDTADYPFFAMLDVNGNSIIDDTDRLEIIRFDAGRPSMIPGSGPMAAEFTESGGEVYWSETEGVRTDQLALSIDEEKTIRLDAMIPADRAFHLYNLTLTYNPSLIEVLSAEKASAEFALGIVNTDTPGTIIINGFDLNGVSGEAIVPLLNIRLKGIAEGDFNFDATANSFGSRTGQFKPDINPLSVSIETAQQIIKPNPENNATDVPINISVTALFSIPIDSGSVNTDTFFVTAGAAYDYMTIPGTVTYEGTTAVFTPPYILHPGTAYIATITTGIRDLDGNYPLKKDYVWSFTTESVPFITTDPENQETGVLLNTPVSAKFKKEMDASSISQDTFFLFSGTGYDLKTVTGTITYHNTTAVFTPASDLNPDTTYTAVIGSAIKDAEGNMPLQYSYRWIFTTGAYISSEERQILIDLFNSTGGENWTNKDNWLGEPGTEQDWYGVVFEDGHVKGIDLSGNNLVGTIPASLGSLTYLEYLNLNNNQLTGSIPAELGNLSNLETLYLSYNQLKDVIPGELGNLTSLRELFLHNNHLSGAIPKELGNLANLEIFGLDSNLLIGPVPTELTKLTNLKEGGSDLRWNALYTEDDTLRQFLNTRQSEGDWESTQTVDPLNLKADKIKDTSVTLTWLPIAYTDGYEGSGYEIWYSLVSGSDADYIRFGITPDKTAQSMTVTGLTPDTKYFFKIRTVSSHYWNTVYSEYSDEIAVKTEKTASADTPPVIQIKSVTPRTDGSGYIDVLFTGTDAEGDSVTWYIDPNENYCGYSTAPDYNIYEPLIPLFVNDDPAHTAVEIMTFSPTGKEFTAVVNASLWNPGNYRVRLKVQEVKATDIHSNYDPSEAFQIIELPYTLNISVSPYKGGKVTVCKAGTQECAINCPGDCFENYASGESLTITATPEAGYLFDHWTGGLTGSVNPAIITVDANKEITAVFVFVHKPCQISGKVLASDNTPMAGVSVDATDLCGESWYSHGITDENGDYSITNLPAGTYYISANFACNESQPCIKLWWNNSSGTEICNDAVPITLTAGQTVKDINLILQTHGSISGYVYLNDNITPVSYMEIYAEDYETGELIGKTYTDNKGFYSIKWLNDGEYLIRTVSDPCNSLYSYIPEYYNNSYDKDKAEPVKVKASGNTANINFILDLISPRAVIEGAVDDGIAWLAKSQNSDGSWGTESVIAKTALALFNLGQHALNKGYSSVFDAEYLYHGQAEKGFDYLFAHAVEREIGIQSAGNPDLDGDGIGIYFQDSWKRLSRSEELGFSEIFNTSTAMMAIAASNTPEHIISNLNSPAYNRSFKELLQDAVDFIAWAQTDKQASEVSENSEILSRGGWSSIPMNNYSYSSDQFNSGWATVALSFAHEKFNILIPEFVKTELNFWIDSIQDDVDGDEYDGGSHYTNLSDDSDKVGLFETGTLLCQMAFAGDTKDTQRVKNAIAYLNKHWSDADNTSWLVCPACSYTTYFLMKGLTSFGIDTLDASEDWFEEFADSLLSQQTSEGWWLAGCFDQDGERIFSSEWTLMTLQNKVIQKEKPDLIISEKSLSWTDKNTGVYTIFYTVKNQGNIAAPVTAASLFIDGVEVKQETVPLLEPGATYSFTTGITLSGESDEIKICADIKNEADEQNEANNCITTIWYSSATLSVSLSPSEGGTVTGCISGTECVISCPGACSESYSVGTNVTLTALPKQGYLFDHWEWTETDIMKVYENPLIITVYADKAVTAVFREYEVSYTLNVSVYPGGTVAANGLICHTNFCHGTYNLGTWVTLTAIPISGYYFAGWEGDLSGLISSTTILMDKDKNVTAVFEPTSIPKYHLNIEVYPQGSGTVSASGINCPDDCSEIYNEGTALTLIADPKDGYQFVGWEGDLSGSDLSASVTMNSDKTVKAVFELIPVVQYNLNVTVYPEGSGTVSASGISCPDDCSEIYNEGTALTLIADPKDGYQFVGWEEDLSGSDLSASVTMNSDKTVKAVFELIPVVQYNLNVTVYPEGSGTVSASGISCPDDCSEKYAYETAVTLLASPENGYQFVRWEGDINSSVSSTDVLIDKDKNVTAVFEPASIPQHHLNVSVYPEGSGTVSASGINCPDDCSEIYAEGTAVMLAAAPKDSYQFVRWEGDINSSVSSTDVLIDKDKNVTAVFEPASIPQHHLNVSVYPEGSGTVSASGINCPDDCSEIYAEGTAVMLAAEPKDSFRFVGWEGDLSGSDLLASVTMNSDKTVKAVFKAIPQNEYVLNISIDPEGSAAVSGSGIDCPGDCTEIYTDGTTVTLLAKPGDGYQFGYWGWYESYETFRKYDNPLTLEMDSDKDIQLVLIKAVPAEYPLNISVSPEDKGTVTDGYLLNCSEECTQYYTEGTYTTLTATPESGYKFDHWEGDITGSDNPVKVLMDSGKSITAVFSEIPMSYYTMDVSVSPEGKGSITDCDTENEICGIKCPDDCTQAYIEGTVVQLTALPMDGYSFDHWEWTDKDGILKEYSNPFSFTMNSDMEITAVFKIKNEYILNISVEGNGNVTAEGINCPGDCREFYITGTSVTLTAEAESGYQFDHWDGDLTGSDNPVKVVIDSDKNITAVFKEIPPPPEYTLNISVEGNGKVTAEGIDCPDLCEGYYISGTEVILTAKANSGYLFDHWEGDLTGSDLSASVTMNSDKTVKAVFTIIPPDEYVLNVSVYPSGSGLLSGIGINCPSDCTEIYTQETAITLIAIPNDGYQFAYWEGNVFNYDNSLSVVMDSDKNITAVFIEIPPVEYTLNVSVQGKGKVTADNIDCPGNCNESYITGTEVTLTAEAESGYRFDRWEGALTGSDNPVTVVMNSDKKITAVFSEIPPAEYTLNVSVEGNGKVTADRYQLPR